MRMTLWRIAAAFALTLAITPASAAEVHAGWEAGVGLMRESLGNFKPAAGAPGLGLCLLIDLGEGHLLRPKVSDWLFSRRQMMGDPNALVRYSHTAAFTSAGVDYVFIPGGNVNMGFYLVIGAGVSRNRMSLDLPVPGTEGASMFHVSGTSTKPVYDLGWGYQHNAMLGTEIRYETSRWVSPADQAGTQTFNINMLKATLTMRF